MAKAEQSGLQTHRGDGKRFVARADEKLTAFLKPNLLRLVATFVRDFASLVSDSRNLEGHLWSGAGIEWGRARVTGHRPPAGEAFQAYSYSYITRSQNVA
jgi:hypothetical protein